MKPTKAAIAAAAIALLFSVRASAELTVQQILDGITQAPLPGMSSVNVATDKVPQDAFWQLDASGGAAAQMIVEIAGNANVNSFGIYQGGTFIPIFGGPAVAGTKAAIFIDGAGNVDIFNVGAGAMVPAHYANAMPGRTFGFYLNDGANTFLSNTSGNPDGVDHLWAFQGKNDTVVLPGSAHPATWTPDEYVLAWEDQLGGGDLDHNDMLVMIESVAPVPEPTTILAGALLLLPFGVSAIRWLRKNKTS